MKRILGYVRRTDAQYGMISHGETVAVGLSGGKDSMALLKALSLYRRFEEKTFDIHAFTVDLGFGGFDTRTISDYCRSLDIPHTVIETRIGEIVLDVRKESNPCALCAKMRKGALFAELTGRGIVTCAFAHHREDCLESFLLSLLYEGRLHTFVPVTRLEHTGVKLIRPLIEAPEKEIKAAVKRCAVPAVANPCPAAGITKRAEIKKLLALSSASNPRARERMLTAIKNTFWKL